MSESAYYYVEKVPGNTYEKSKIRCICGECKEKLFPTEKMMFHTGAYGSFEVKCHACERKIHAVDPPK
jgi:predicted  nucleic acid-binding Zn ribbon protein